MAAAICAATASCAAVSAAAAAAAAAAASSSSSSSSKKEETATDDSSMIGGNGGGSEDIELVQIASSAFDPRPFFRLFSNIIEDFTAPESGFQGELPRLRVLTAIGNTLHAVQPSRVPQFAFAWIELVSHRSFMVSIQSDAGAM